MRPKLLITGASGFLGHALALAAAGRDLPTRIALRRPDPRFAVGFETVMVSGLEPDADWTRAVAGVQVVVHCAARAHVLHEREGDPLAEYRRVNVAGTLNLARQAIRAGAVRLVFISSIGVNGAETFGHAFTADDQPAPAHPYAVSKFEAEIGLRKLSEDSGLEIVVIRPPLVYGPGARGNLASMIRWIEAGIPLPLGAVGNKRSLVALDNLTDLILVCLQHPAASNQTLLVCDGEDLSTTDLLRALGSAIGKPVRLIPVPPALLRAAAFLGGRSEMAQKLLGSLQIDASKTRELLNWAPPISLREGLRSVARSWSNPATSP